jgi:hypothetical protein
VTITTYILILIMAGPHQGGLSMQEFNSKSSCESALSAAIDLFKFKSAIRGVCVPK